jgi:hypothetical protein
MERANDSALNMCSTWHITKSALYLLCWMSKNHKYWALRPRIKCLKRPNSAKFQKMCLQRYPSGQKISLVKNLIWYKLFNCENSLNNLSWSFICNMILKNV